MDTSPAIAITTPTPTRRWRALRRAGLTLLCVSLLATPGGAFARVPVARYCSHASPHQVYAPRGFGGYLCRDERCSSHKAGFDWAERNGIADARACISRHDPAFAEGCRVYAEEAVTAAQAGFDWARENEIADTCDCTGAGPGFDAGCVAYVTGPAQ